MIQKSIDEKYHSLLNSILTFGSVSEDRTKTGVIYLFGQQVTWDCYQGVPILTSKKIAWKNTISELLWFLSGSTNVKDLPSSTQPWWLPWANIDGSLGPTYGHQLRKGSDQILTLINGIKTNPQSRRHILSTWNAEDLKEMNLPPCHGLVTQFNVRDGVCLDMSTYQRSADMFIGWPINILSYYILLRIISDLTGLKAGRIIYNIGNAHIYKNHLNQVKELLGRSPPINTAKLKISKKIKSIDCLSTEDFSIENYTYLAPIKAPLAI